MAFFRPRFLAALDLNRYKKRRLAPGERIPFYNDHESYLLLNGALEIYLEPSGLRASAWGEIQRSPICIGQAQAEALFLPPSLSLMSKDHHVVIHANTDCVLVRIPNEDLYRCIDENPQYWPNFNAVAGALMEEMLHRLHLVSEQSHATWDHVQDSPLEVGDEHREMIKAWSQLPQNTPLRLDKDIELFVGIHRPGDGNVAQWMRVLEGEFSVCDDEYATIDASSGLYPLAYPMYLRSKAPSRVELYRTLDSAAQSQAAMNAFYSDYLYLSRRNRRAERDQRHIEIVRQAEREASIKDDAERSFAKILDGEDHQASVPENKALRVVLEQIGELLGVDIVVPREVDASLSIEEKLKRVCWRSELRHRPIHLDEGWEEHSHSPLLGFLKDSMQPVMLAPDAYENFYIHDVVKGERIPLNDETKALLSGEAHVFFQEIPDAQATSPFSVLRHFTLASSRRFMTFTLVANILLATMFGAAIPIAIQFIFDRVVVARDIPLLMQVTLVASIVLLARGVCTYVGEMTNLRLQGLAAHEFACSVWSRFLRLPSRFCREMPSGETLVRLEAPEEIVMRLGALVPTVLAGVATIIYPFVIAYYSVPIAFIVVGSALPVALFAYLCARQIAYLVLEQLRRESELRSFTIESLLGIAKLRSSASESRIYAHWAKIFGRVQELAFSVLRREALLKVVAETFPILMSAAVLALLMFGAAGEELSVGVVAALLSAVSLFWTDVSRVLISLGEVAKLIIPWHRLAPLLEAKPEYHSDHIAPPVQGHIELRDLSFSYTPTSEPVLNHASLTIEPGDFAAIVGSSGCGKTTLIRLLTGFEEPTGGKVLIDGVNLFEMNLQSIRSQMAVVMQDASLTVSSMRDFLRLGGAKSEEEMWWALDFAGLREEVEHLAMGLETLISDQEGVFSSGQRQRLLIARALIGHPRILIFDEAMSALDDVNQRRIVSMLEQLSITRVVVTHRLGSIVSADRIFVLDKGQVVQQGTFTELARQEGRFKQLLRESEEL